MLYIIVDNFAGVAMCFDNETDFKRFIKDWKHYAIENDGFIDYANFTAYCCPHTNMNINYDDYMDSAPANEISLL